MRPHRLRAAAALLLATALTASCQNTVSLPTTEAPSDPGLSVQTAEFGEVAIRVRWPEYTPQAIPYSANSLLVVAFDGLGRIASQALLTRNGSPDSLSATTMRLRAGTYTIEARAYREASPSIASEPTAIGSTGNVRVKTNLKTQMSLTLNAVAPTHGAFSSAAGGVGSSFTIDTVQFFGRPVKASDVVEVFMGQDPALGQHAPYRVRATVSIEPRRRLDAISGVNQMVDPEQDMIRVVVPSGVKGECRVWLKVDGVEVDAGAFHVVDRMTFDQASVTRAVDESYDAMASLKPYALDTVRALSYPILTWTSSNPAVAFVTTGGMVYAYRPGQTTITARSGSVSAAFTLVSTDRHSTASITVGVPDLGSGTVNAPITFPEYSGNDNGTVTP